MRVVNVMVALRVKDFVTDEDVLAIVERGVESSIEDEDDIDRTYVAYIDHSFGSKVAEIAEGGA